MNKNIITIGVLLSASVMTELSAPSFELYADNFAQKSRVTNSRPSLTQISQAKVGKSYVDMTQSLFSFHSLCVKSTTTVQLDEIEILKSVANKIKNSKPLPEEFSKIIDDNFWDLI